MKKLDISLIATSDVLKLISEIIEGHWANNTKLPEIIISREQYRNLIRETALLVGGRIHDKRTREGKYYSQAIADKELRNIHAVSSDFGNVKIVIKNQA